MENNLAFDHAFKVMGATQQLMVRSLINLIEMISTSSHRYAQDNSAFTDEAMSLMKKATATRGPESLRDLQKEWAQTCMKFSQSQTRATMGFVEQFGQQVLGTIANNPFTPAMSSAAEPTAAPSPKTAPKPAAVKTPVAKKAAAPKASPAKVITAKAAPNKAIPAKADKPKAAPKAASKPATKTPRKNSTNAEKL